MNYFFDDDVLEYLDYFGDCLKFSYGKFKVKCFLIKSFKEDVELYIRRRSLDYKLGRIYV